MTGGVARSVLAAFAALVLAGCAPGGAPAGTPGTGDRSSPPATPDAPRRTQIVTVPAPSLAGNLLGEPTERKVLVTFPASYFSGDQRYPVVYFLEGYQDSTGAFLTVAADLDKQMAASGAREFIIVEADGINSLGGNFYANSPVGGNMADFIAKDLVSYVDANLRTVPHTAARGIAGFSMGGGGTVNLALSRPDVFGSAYALSPGLLDPHGGLAAMLADNGSWPAYAAAFAPDTSATASPFAHLLDPAIPLRKQDPAVVAAYEGGFGNLAAKVDAYLAGSGRLTSLRLSYGRSDQYTWIPAGTKYLDRLLSAQGVDHSLRTFDGGHSIDDAFYQGDFVDFRSRQLSAS